MAKKKKKNSLVASIKEDLITKREQLRTIKAEELNHVQELVILRKRRSDLEKIIQDDEQYIAHIEKHE